MWLIFVNAHTCFQCKPTTGKSKGSAKWLTLITFQKNSSKTLIQNHLFYFYSKPLTCLTFSVSVSSIFLLSILWRIGMIYNCLKIRGKPLIFCWWKKCVIIQWFILGVLWHLSRKMYTNYHSKIKQRNIQLIEFSLKSNANIL